MENKIEINLRNQKSMTASFISWNRLEDLLKRSCDLKENEVIDKICVENNGITYYIGKENG